MNHWGIVALIAFLIALGLVLRFGGNANAIAKTGFSGISEWIKDLTLSSNPGVNA